MRCFPRRTGRSATVSIVVGLLMATGVNAVEARRARPEPARAGKIAFTRGADIWMMNADGSHPVPLTASFGFGAQPAWQPVFDADSAPPEHDRNVPRCFGERATIVGTDRDDSVRLDRGRQTRDVVVTFGGDDTVRIDGASRDGLADLVCTGDGDDLVQFEDGYSGSQELCQPVKVDLGLGNDRFRGLTDTQESVSDPVPLGEVCPDAQSVVFGGPGDDRINGGDGDDLLYGGPGDDVLIGWFGSDEIFGGPGHDEIDGADTYFVEHSEGADPNSGFDQILKNPDDFDACRGGPGTDRFEHCDEIDSAPERTRHRARHEHFTPGAIEPPGRGILFRLLTGRPFFSWL